MRIRAVLSAAVLACSMCACTGENKPVRPHPATTPSGEVVARAEKTPLTFGTKPLWTDRTRGVPRDADRFTLHGDRVIMYSWPKGGFSNQLSVLDAATGRPLWSVRIGRPLPGGHGDMWAGRSPDDPAPQVVERGRGWGVLIPTRHGDGPQAAYGVALLSGEDGHPLWRRPLVPSQKSPARGVRVQPSLVLTDSGVVVVGLRPVHGGRVADLRLAGVDALSGKPLWTRTGIRPAAISRGYVIATEWPVPASTAVEGAGTGTVTVLEERSGRTLWSLRDRMDASSMAATAGGLVLVRGRRGTTSTTPIAMELETGTEVARMPDQTGTCAGDGVNLIACSVQSPKPLLYTIRADERKIRVAGHPDPTGELITLVRDDRIYYAGGDNPVQEVDRSGTPLVGGLPDGLLLALDDKYAVFGVPVHRTFQVYRVG